MLKQKAFSYITFVCIVFQTEARHNKSDNQRDMKDLGASVWCKFQPNTFDCSGKQSSSRFYYDLKMQDCLTFEYGSCPNKYNNYVSLSDCQEACRDTAHSPIDEELSLSVVCRLQQDFGECFDYFPMWYFDIGERICKGFSYSGCGGNKNRFPNAQICIAACAKAIEF